MSAVEETRVQEMQMQASQMPVINGLSPTFLRLLVDEARQLSKAGQLVTSDDDAWCQLTGLGAVVLYHIADQLRGGWQDMNWSIQHPAKASNAANMILAAEGFLNII